MLEFPETFNVVPLEIAAVVVNAAVETAAPNVVAPLIVNCAGLWVPHNTVITPSTEKNVIKVATKQHKDKLYFKRESIDTSNMIEGKKGTRTKK